MYQLRKKTGPAYVPASENKLWALQPTKPAHKKLECVPDQENKLGTSHTIGVPQNQDLPTKALYA